MGTRAGEIDGNAVLRLAETHGIAGAKRLLNEKSGLLALGGASDMRISIMDMYFSQIRGTLAKMVGDTSRDGGQL